MQNTTQERNPKKNFVQLSIFSFSAFRIKILQVKKNLILTAYSFENIPSFIK